MSTKKETWAIPSGLAVSIIGVLLTGAISFNAWAVAAVFERPPSDEVKELIEYKSPYRADRSMILQVLEDVRRSNLELKQAIAQHTNTLAELKALIREK